VGVWSCNRQLVGGIIQSWFSLCLTAHCDIYTRAAKSARVITVKMTTVTFGKMQWMPLIAITWGHSLIGNNDWWKKNAAVQHCFLMQSRNVYIKRWKWTERKIYNQAIQIALSWLSTVSSRSHQ
jgi:hypothetical protein